MYFYETVQIYIWPVNEKIFTKENIMTNGSVNEVVHPPVIYYSLINANVYTELNGVI